MIDMGLLVSMVMALAPQADPATIEAAVQDWLDDHPEATTTVTDGSITMAKLASEVASKINQITSLSDEIDGIDSDVTDLKSALDSIDDVLYVHEQSKTDIVFTIGGYIKTGNVTNVNLTPTTDQTARYAIVDCFEGDIFEVNCKSYQTARAWCFIDSTDNNKIISSSGTGSISETITAPANADKVIFNDDANSQGGAKKVNPAGDGLIIDVKELEIQANEFVYSSENDKTILFPQSFFEQGTFGSSGSEAESNYAIRTKEKVLTTREIKFIPHSGYRVFVVQYSKDGIYESQTGWESTTQSVPANKQFRFAISHTTPTQETALTDYGKVLPVGSSYDEYLLHNAIKDENDHAWAIREGLLKYNASIFGTESNAYGTLYYVGENETYTTINDALTAWAEDDYPNATIFIRNGEYNETVEVEGKTIRFIGESRDGTIIHTTTGNYVNPPFNVRHGTVTLKNMTLIADHSENPDFDYEAQPTLKAYGIHIDGGNVGGIVTVENCTIMSFQAPAVGTGTIPNSKIRLIDCDCYCFTDYTSDQSSAQFAKLALGCILWHTSNPSIYPSRGTEEFELVNVRAYMKNHYVVLKTDRSDPDDSMNMLAINTLLLTDRNPNDQNPVSGPVNPVSGSIGNNNNTLNYQS